VPFGSGAYSYFRLFILTVVVAVDLRSPDHLGLAPHPPIAGRLQNRSSQFDSAADAGETLSGRFRRFLTESATARGLADG
jgi:hypothetical protein